jgi:hypothetical protein
LPTDFFLKIVGANKPKPVVPVPVVRIVPVANRSARIVGFIVESAPAQHAVTSAWPYKHGACHAECCYNITG